MLVFDAWYPETFFKVGYPETTSYLLQDLQTTSYNIWRPNKWTHVCISFDKSNLHLRVVKVKSYSKVRGIIYYWGTFHESARIFRTGKL